MVQMKFSSYCFFFFKQKTAYEMRISDWSSDVCSSDLAKAGEGVHAPNRIASAASPGPKAIAMPSPLAPRAIISASTNRIVADDILPYRVSTDRLSASAPGATASACSTASSTDRQIGRVHV